MESSQHPSHVLDSSRKANIHSLAATQARFNSKQRNERTKLVNVLERQNLVLREKIAKIGSITTVMR